MIFTEEQPLSCKQTFLKKNSGLETVTKDTDAVPIPAPLDFHVSPVAKPSALP